MIRRKTRIILTCADITAILKELRKAGVSIQGLRHRSDLEYSFWINATDWNSLYTIAKRYGAEVVSVDKKGLMWHLSALKKRGVLCTFIFLLIIASIWLPGRVLFISVEGNDRITTYYILQEAENCGIAFGAKRSDVRSEPVKNKLLEAIPDLRWAGITTTGCTAVIHVAENREVADAPAAEDKSSIFARIDGVIVDAIITSGEERFIIGDAVKEGQLLVSIYKKEQPLDPATNAEGEIYALTRRNFTVYIPANRQIKTDTGDRRYYYSVIAGKKRINLYKGSGISYIGCDKIYTETYLSLPGGFQLPFGIAEETVISYEEDNTALTEDTLIAEATKFAKRHLLEQMISGRVLSLQSKLISIDSFATISFDAQCIEMIGRKGTEERELQYGKVN